MSYIQPRLFAEEITFNTGQKLSLRSDDIVVFVGANNVGKSQLLGQIVQKAQRPNLPSHHYGPGSSNYQSETQPHQIVSSVTLGNEGSLADFRHWVADKFHALPVQPGSNSPPKFRFGSMTFSGEDYQGSRWEGLTTDRHGNRPYVGHFWHSLDIMNRLHVNQNPMQLGHETAQDALQRMYESPDEEDRFSTAFREAFGADLIVNRFGGGSIPLHVGTRPIPTSNEDYFSPEFARRFRTIPLLDMQGNGMRSFYGLLTETEATSRSGLFIDEPEVFLHPPQARLLGRFLAERSTGAAQIFMATHNGSFIRGVLDAASDRVRIVRLDRNGSMNPIHELTGVEITDFWNDTILRYSSALDGLFYRRVVVCESDSDCRFYAAIGDVVNKYECEQTHFVSAGGKDRVHVVAQALTRVGVDVRAVLDFDVLNQTRTMQRICEALNGDWAAIGPLAEAVRRSIEERRPDLDAAKAAEEIRTILDLNEGTNLTRDSGRAIKSILAKGSSWATAKKVGASAIPRGNATQSWQALHSSCRQLGFQIVEGGEMESFYPSIGNKSQKWVSEVLKRDLAEDPALESARQFVARLFE